MAKPDLVGYEQDCYLIYFLYESKFNISYLSWIICVDYLYFLPTCIGNRKKYNGIGPEKVIYPLKMGLNSVFHEALKTNGKAQQLRSIRIPVTCPA